MDRQMNRWLDSGMDGHTNGQSWSVCPCIQIFGHKLFCKDELSLMTTFFSNKFFCHDGWTDSQIDGWLDRWMVGWMDGWVDGWMNEQKIFVCQD